MLTLTSEGLYQSSLLSGVPGIVHGFTGRLAGDMRNDTVNRKRFLEAIGIEGTVATVHQIHSNTVYTVRSGEASETVPDADGVLYTRRGHTGTTVIPVIFTADCVPVLLSDVESGTIAAVHSGWRGTASRIVERAVSLMCAEGARVERIVAAFGPHISMCCYSVKDDVATRFTEAFSSTDGWLAKSPEGVWHLSLAGCIRQQLITAGVPAPHIDAHPICTSCCVSDFFSYRRDTSGTYGEMMAFIALRKASIDKSRIMRR